MGIARPKSCGSVSPINALDGATCGKHLARNIESREQFIVPFAALYVVEQCAAGVRRVCRVNAPARQLPYQPGINRAERELALFGEFARACDIVQQPSHLRSRKISVKHQPRALLKDRSKSVATQAVAHLSRAAALPHDGVVNRLARLAVPDDSRFALIGDADSRDLIGFDIRFRKHALGCVQLRIPDVGGAMLDPSGLRIELLELLLGCCNGIACLIEKNRARTGCPLIERENVVLAHLSTPKRYQLQWVSYDTTASRR